MRFLRRESFVLALLCGWAAPALAQSSGRALGTFRVTYYFVAQEHAGGNWPLYAPACSHVLAHTSEEFHQELSREGTGRLRDGRMLNFSERCDCAGPGHGGNRICYEELDRGAYPWGKGGKRDGRDFVLRPFRSLAVDPKVIALGTAIYVPAWRGGNWPDGSPRDGCFRAVDTGSAVRGRHLDLFTGTAHWAKPLQTGNPKKVLAYANAAVCGHVKAE